MKKNSWSKDVVKAAGAYYAIKKAKKFRPKLWTGYGFDGDDLYRDYSEIEQCFTCTSVNGDNPSCERQDGNILLNLINMQSCDDDWNYCGLVITQHEGDTYFQRGCYPRRLMMDNVCPNIVENIFENDVVSSIVRNSYCDYCDSNGCNGWTLRSLPDESFYNSEMKTLISNSLMLFVTMFAFI